METVENGQTRIIRLYDIQWDVSGEGLTKQEERDLLRTLPAEDEIEVGPAVLQEYELSPDATDEEILNDEGIMEDISDLLSDMYGFCHDGFRAEIVHND